MLSTRAIVSVKYTPASSAAGKAVGGLLRYVQHRDHQEPAEREQGIAGLVRYVAHRDAASPEGRLFDMRRTAGTPERKELVRYVRRSLVDARDKGNRPGRAVYRFVFSPEDARGLDLRQATRTVMEQLERDTGEKLPPWIAAEHRNTAHPHVHVILAARREDSPGKFREIRISPQRLARMKVTLGRELQRQRSERRRELPLARRLLEAALPQRRSSQRSSDRVLQRKRPGNLSEFTFTGHAVQGFFRRIAHHYRRETEMYLRERERERQREGGWER